MSRKRPKEHIKMVISALANSKMAIIAAGEHILKAAGGQ